MQAKSHWFSLPEGNARKITLRMCIPAVLAYMAKVLINQSLEYDRGGGLWFLLCPLICVVGVGLVVGLIVIAVRRTQYLVRAIMLIIGIGLSIFFPLPPLPKPVFPEEVFFTNHRADFEAVINLARADKLECVALQPGAARLWRANCHRFLSNFQIQELLEWIIIFPKALRSHSDHSTGIIQLSILKILKIESYFGIPSAKIPAG